MKYLIMLFPLIISSPNHLNSDNEWFLYSSNVNGNSDIFMMNYTTKEIKQLTTNQLEEWAAVWVNRNEITFFRDNNGTIERIKLDLKTNKETMINHPSNCILDDKNVQYSPNSDLQVYSCNGKLYLFNPTDDTIAEIGESLSGKSAYPSWTFDGKQIIFTNNGAGTNGIYRFNVETSEISMLVDFNSNDERGELSPDQKFLAFSSNKDNSANQDILVLDLISGRVKNISKSSGNELIVKWSNDGLNLLYGGDSDGNWELYRYDMQSQTTERLTNNKAFDGDPRFFKHFN